MLSPSAAAAAPLDEAQRARVANLEQQLVSLTAQLRQRRESVPAWTAQRLEEANNAVMSSLVSGAQEAEAATDGGAAEETRLALTSAMQHCTAVSNACADQASGEVQRALSQASEMATQISATLGALGAASCPTATDLAIAPPGAVGGDKENSSYDVAAALRRRRDAQQRAGLPRQEIAKPFLAM